jgi:hypothetical protein
MRTVVWAVAAAVVVVALKGRVGVVLFVECTVEDRGVVATFVVALVVRTVLVLATCRVVLVGVLDATVSVVDNGMGELCDDAGVVTTTVVCLTVDRFLFETLVKRSVDVAEVVEAGDGTLVACFGVLFEGVDGRAVMAGVVSRKVERAVVDVAAGEGRVVDMEGVVPGRVDARAVDLSKGVAKMVEVRTVDFNGVVALMGVVGIIVDFNGRGVVALMGVVGIIVDLNGVVALMGVVGIVDGRPVLLIVVLVLWEFARADMVGELCAAVVVARVEVWAGRPACIVV